MSSPRPRRFAPGHVVLALTAVRKNFARALSVADFAAGGRRSHVWNSKAVAQSDVATPPVSPMPDDGIMSFYLLRHGQTNFNAVGRIQGTLDASILTEQGTSQAYEVGKILATSPELEFGPTAVVSPMRRAQQTLSCVREEFRKVDRDFQNVEVVPNIREIELFEWQGELVQDIQIRWPEEYAAWKTDPCSFNIDGRYPAKDLWARASEAWEHIRSLESIQGQQKTLVVAHNAINQALLWTALGCDMSYFRKLPWPNCAVLELQWHRGHERAERYRWVVPEPSPFVEAVDAARLMKDTADDDQYTL